MTERLVELVGAERPHESTDIGNRVGPTFVDELLDTSGAFGDAFEFAGLLAFRDGVVDGDVAVCVALVAGGVGASAFDFDLLEQPSA